MAMTMGTVKQSSRVRPNEAEGGGELAALYDVVVTAAAPELDPDEPDELLEELGTEGSAGSDGSAGSLISILTLFRNR